MSTNVPPLEAGRELKVQSLVQESKAEERKEDRNARMPCLLLAAVMAS